MIETKDNELRLKVNPILETGLTLVFDPKKYPIENPCHLHLRWAKEKCPICGSSMMIYYCPTSKHEAGIGAAFPDEGHKIIVSCVKCRIVTMKTQ